MSPKILEFNKYLEILKNGQRTFASIFLQIGFKYSLLSQNFFVKFLNIKIFPARILALLTAGLVMLVAIRMGYKTSEKGRKAGYKQIKNLKKIFKQKAQEILEKEDVIPDTNVIAWI